MSWKTLSVITATISLITFIIVAYGDLSYHKYLRIGFMGIYSLVTFIICLFFAVKEEDKSNKEYKERLLKSTEILKSDIEVCIDDLLKARKHKTDERAVFSKMENLLVSTQQQIDCLIDYIKK